MNLGLFLSPGDSLEKQQQTGQLERLIKYYLEPYSKHFKQIYLFSYGDCCKYYSLPSNLTLVSKPKLIPNYLYQLILVFIHRQIIRQIDVNRVFQAPGGLAAVIAKIFYKKPYVVSNNYDYVRFARIENKPILAKILSWLLPLILRQADKIITPLTISNGVDPSVFRPAAVKPEQYLVLSVGRLVRQKNQESLIKTVSLSCFKNKIKLVIIGSGPLRLQLKKLAQDSDVNLTIISNLKHRDLLEWYQKAAVFGLTSLLEGQPKVLLEAMSCACACLTTSFPANPVKDNWTGLIGVKAEELAVKLDQVLSNPGLGKKLGQQARQVVLEKFDIKQLVRREIKLLKSIHEV